MLIGRLGLDSARVPPVDRHALLSLDRGRLHAEDGTLHFACAGGGVLTAGDYGIPFQMLSCLLLGPGSTVSHDASRLLARHGTGLVFTGDGAVRMYASMPFGPDDSSLARRQAGLWADVRLRNFVARRMYFWRLGETLPESDIHVLRGIEGARMKVAYREAAKAFGIPWSGRLYDRANPDQTDLVNQAINHAAIAMDAAAMVAVAVTGTLPQLGFIHEDSGRAFCLDLADLFRDSMTLPIAFGAFRAYQKSPRDPLERHVRRLANQTFREKKVVAQMIQRIKEILSADDGDRNQQLGTSV